MRLFSTITILLFTIGMISAQSHVTIKIKHGDTFTRIFEKYNLNGHPCNVKKYKELNRTNSLQLIKDKFYKLPIKVYSYNGKSIRSTIGISDYDQASRIQKYNEVMSQGKIKAKDYRIDKVLWVPYHEVDCGNIKLKEQPQTEPDITDLPTSQGRNFPIFGKDYQYVPLETNQLKGKIFYIVSGHGGPDPGAVNRKNSKKFCEDEYAYDIALRLARNLISHGATTYIIIRDPNDGIRSGEYLPIDKDERCWKNQKIPLNQKERLNQRATAINKLYAKHKKQGVKDKDQKTVVIHIDSRSVHKRLDVFFYYFPGSKAGKTFVTTLQQTIKKEYSKHQRNRGYSGTVKARDLFMLRETKPVTAYIELGNIKNPTDEKRFLVESNRQALANWLLKGLILASKS